MDIKDFTFQEKAKFGDSYFEDGTSLPNATSITSSAVDFAQVQSSLGIQIKAASSVVILLNATIKFELLHDTTEDGTFTDSVEMGTITGADPNTTYAADAEMLNYVPNEDIGKWCKLKVTCSGDQSAGSIDAFSYIIAR